MIPAPFAYARPTTVEEALQAIAQGGADVKVLAGGQSLIPVMRLRLAAPSTVVDLARVGELRGVRDDGDAIVIGAMTTHSDVIADPLVQQFAPLVAKATETVAYRQVRHRGTFGGALAHADPAGDLPACALALDAEFVIVGPGGRRTVPARDFFVDYLTTALEEGELLVEVRIPKLQGEWGMHYEKFNRVAQAWSIVAVAAAVRGEDGRIADAGHRRRAGPGGSGGQRGGDRRGGRARGGGDRPEQRPECAGRLPRAPGAGAHPPGGDTSRRAVA